MVKVFRQDYPERNWTDRRGKEHYKPAHYYCEYVYNGIEIANYNSTDDVLYLNTKCIDKNYWDKTFNRAMNGAFADAYKELFKMLNVDENTELSEFLNL